MFMGVTSASNRGKKKKKKKLSKFNNGVHVWVDTEKNSHFELDLDFENQSHATWKG